MKHIDLFLFSYKECLLAIFLQKQYQYYTIPRSNSTLLYKNLSNNICLRCPTQHDAVPEVQAPMYAEVGVNNGREQH